MASVLALDGPKRLAHTIARIVDWEEAWTLRGSNGWALVADGEQMCLPLWPHREYAELLAHDDWVSFAATRMDLETLSEELLATLADASLGVSVFPTPNCRGISVSVSELSALIDEESRKYG